MREIGSMIARVQSSTSKKKTKNIVSLIREREAATPLGDWEAIRAKKT